MTMNSWRTPMTRRNKSILVTLVVLALSSSWSIGAEDSPIPITRPFLMGFTRWPADLTPEGVLTAQNFTHEHGDIVSVMFIGGIPWPESLAEQPYSQDEIGR